MSPTTAMRRSSVMVGRSRSCEGLRRPVRRKAWMALAISKGGENLRGSLIPNRATDSQPVGGEAEIGFGLIEGEDSDGALAGKLVEMRSARREDGLQVAGDGFRSGAGI